MRTIIYKHVKHINTDELDFLNREQIFPDLGEDEDLNEIYKDKTNILNTPVSINYLRGLLDELETKGANYVSIDYHTDHIEYELDGIIAREATQEEIDDQKEKDRQFQIEHARKESNRLENTADQYRKRLEELSSGL